MATEATEQNNQKALSVGTINKATIDDNLTMKRAGPNVDALQILEPVRRKLASIEAERIISVIEKTIDKLEKVTLLSHIAKNLDRFSVALGLELTCALREHVRIEQHFYYAVTKLIEPEHHEEDENGKHKLKTQAERQNNFTLLQQALGSSVKNIIRLFEGNPAACQIIQTECRARKPLSMGLILALKKLRNFVFGRLLISPREENEKNEFVENIILQDKQNTEIIATLEAELAAAIEDKENEMLKKNEIIRKLKNNLLQLDLFSEDSIRQIKQDSEKQQQGDQKDSEGRIRKFKTETEIENWIQKYDADIQEKQEEYEQLIKIHKEEGILLFELESKIESIESEYVQVIEDRERRAEEKRIREEQIYLMGKAAVTIQSFWKGFKVRQLMKSLKKKKKKGKGKGKRK
ncbi:dynein regulatory complex protein 10 isoform X2 [Rhinoraja longicauda]